MKTSTTDFIRNILQTLAATFSASLFMCGPLLGCFSYFYVLTTRFWWVGLCYLGWLYLDRNTPATGGRQFTWIQNLKNWQYAKDYLSAKLIVPQHFTLNPDLNYLLVCVPHGIISTASFNAFITRTSDFKKLYPNCTTYLSTIDWLFFTPFIRDLGMALGFISCSAKSLHYVLTRPGGSHVACLSPGGAAEAYYSHPGQYKLLLKKRKGFVKIALTTGAALVPVVTFGETDLYYQIDTHKFRAFQNFVKKNFKFVPILFYGRWFPFTPRKVTITTVLGKPIEVVQVENPTQQQIDDIHEAFIKQTVELFDEYKYQFLEKPESKILEFEER